MWLNPASQDVGFNGVWPKLGSDENIINQYFQVYFDQAVGTLSLYPSTCFTHTFPWSELPCGWLLIYLTSVEMKQLVSDVRSQFRLTSSVSASCLRDYCKTSVTPIPRYDAKCAIHHKTGFNTHKRYWWHWKVDQITQTTFLGFPSMLHHISQFLWELFFLSWDFPRAILSVLLS